MATPTENRTEEEVELTGMLSEETRTEDPQESSSDRKNGVSGNILSTMVLIHVAVTSIRFVFLPELLVRLFGSPKYMCAPFVLYAFFYHYTLLILMTLTDYSKYYLRIESYTANAREEANNFYFSRIVVSRGLLVIGLLDIISSAIIILMLVSLYAFVFASGDGGGVDPGWKSEAVMAVVGISFYALSVVVNIVMAFVICCADSSLCRRFCPHALEDRDSEYHLEVSQVERGNSINSMKVGRNELKLTGAYRLRHNFLATSLIVIIFICFGYLCSYLDEVEGEPAGKAKQSSMDVMTWLLTLVCYPFPRLYGSRKTIQH